MTLPGGVKFGGPGAPPSEHGPVVTDYATWVDTTAVATPAAGDLCCWTGLGPDGHIGIALSATRMVSALNGTDGTVITPIQGTGPAGAPLTFRRLTGVVPGMGAGSARAMQQATVNAAGLVLGSLALAVGAVILAAAGAVVVAGMLARRALPSS